MSSLLILLSMENEEYLLKSLDEQKNTIEKFNEFLSDLIKEMNSGNYNMPVLNTLCNFIKEYNIRTCTIEESESESDSESESELESTKLLTSESQSEDDSEDEQSEEEPPVLEKTHVFQSESVKTDEMTLIYENLINNNPTIHKLFMKPSYDIQKNMEIFIGKSNKY